MDRRHRPKWLRFSAPLNAQPPVNRQLTKWLHVTGGLQGYTKVGHHLRWGLVQVHLVLPAVGRFELYFMSSGRWCLNDLVFSTRWEAIEYLRMCDAKVRLAGDFSP